MPRWVRALLGLSSSWLHIAGLVIIKLPHGSFFVCADSKPSSTKYFFQNIFLFSNLYLFFLLFIFCIENWEKNPRCLHGNWSLEVFAKLTPISRCGLLRLCLGNSPKFISVRFGHFYSKTSSTGFSMFSFSSTENWRGDPRSEPYRTAEKFYCRMGCTHRRLNHSSATTTAETIHRARIVVNAWIAMSMNVVLERAWLSLNILSDFRSKVRKMFPIKWIPKCTKLHYHHGRFLRKDRLGSDESALSSIPERVWNIDHIWSMTVRLDTNRQLLSKCRLKCWNLMSVQPCSPMALSPGWKIAIFPVLQATFLTSSPEQYVAPQFLVMRLLPSRYYYLSSRH